MKNCSFFVAKIHDILELRKYIALAPGRKGITMSDIDAQILELFHQLTPEQKKVAALAVILSSLATEQESSVSRPVSDSASAE